MWATFPRVDAFRPTPTYEAYLEFIKGQTLFVRLDFSPAMEHLYRAIELDSSFVEPLALVATAHINQGEYTKADSLLAIANEFRERAGPLTSHFLDSMEAALMAPGAVVRFQWGIEALWSNRTREAIEVLTAIDPLGELAKRWGPYWWATSSAYHMNQDHARELEEAIRGREQFPGQMASIGRGVRALAALGMVEDIHERLDEALTLPSDTGGGPGPRMLLAGRELRAHGYPEASFEVIDRAIGWYKSRAARETGTPTYRSELARALYAAGRWEEAHRLFDDLHRQVPDDVMYLGYLGVLAVRRGDRDEALRISGQLGRDERPYLFGRTTLWRARIAAVLGEGERAMAHLREALSEEADYMTLHADMDLKPLRTYPPFVELMQPVN